MRIPKEKSFPSSSNGVYPHQRQLPSPVCCFRIMHIRTGTMWLAYVEMVWVTSQFSFWAAQAVTMGFHPVITILGFITTMIQAVLIIFLLRGIRRFRLSFLAIYLIGLTLRIVVFASFLLLATILSQLEYEEDDESFIFFRRLFWSKMIFCTVCIMLKLFALTKTFHCYIYIRETRNYFRQPDLHPSLMPSGSNRATIMQPQWTKLSTDVNYNFD